MRQSLIRRLLVALFCGMAALSIAPSHAGEGILNRLLAPGPLIKGHQELEKTECLQCHDVGKGISSDKCMVCHKDIGAFVKAKTGFHGLQTKVCADCHAEHKGRLFDTIKVDKLTFDHSTSGFILEGKHAEISCEKCHVAKRGEKSIHPGDVKWVGATATCVSCHRKDDIHYFKGDWAKKDCNACHNERTWKDGIKFNHEKDGHFKLVGKHAELKCQDCHNPDKQNRKNSAIYHWKNLKTQQCLACHENVHRGNLSQRFQGPKCEACHTQQTWKIPHFNHERIAHYALDGGHAKLQCTDCHKQTAAAVRVGVKAFHWTGLGTRCSSCHEDVHKTNLSPKYRGKCEECHTVEAWKIAKFDHAGVTHYALRGKHAEIDCTKCHLQTAAIVAKGQKYFHWTGLKTQCLDCHKDVHRFGSFRSKRFKSPNTCLECHSEKVWKPANFSHTEDTSFPIDGKHLGLKCDDCHIEKDAKKRPLRVIYHWEHLKTKNCEICHANPHVKNPNVEFKRKRCDQCHISAGWLIMSNGKNFNHDLTRFPLTGKHKTETCKSCHEVKGKQIYHWETADKKFCISCHANVHVGQFTSAFVDKACDTCHTTTDFHNRLPFNHDESRYKLLFKHKELKCEKCHIQTDQVFPAYVPAGSSSKRSTASVTRPPLTPMHKFAFPDLGAHNCADCHKDPHHGGFGGACSECHSEVGWKLTRDFHKDFTLTGVHYTLQCQECHKNERNLVGMSQNCVLCHQKDDIHHGTLPHCGECHKQQFWEDPEFQHSLTRFALRGSHRALDCSSCHSNGIYQGTPYNCSDCHINIAPRVSSPPNIPAHIFPSMLRCDECHNQFQF